MANSQQLAARNIIIIVVADDNVDLTAMRKNPKANVVVGIVVNF